MSKEIIGAKKTENKKTALDAAFTQIDKQYGKGSVMRLGQSPNQTVETVSTGSLLIDHAIGTGGYPRGRITEIYGPEASGKTTLALQGIAQSQLLKGVCAFIDVEHALDPAYAKSIGVNIDDLIISQPDFGEQALDIVETLVKSNALDVIVVDSVAALVPKKELDGEMGDVHVGLQARLMSQALRKLTPAVHKSKTALIFINQIRHKIGGISFGSPETTTGGKALKFYASLRLDVRRIAGLKKAEVHVGNRVAVKIAKNKLAPPFKRVEVDLMFGVGISLESGLIDIAIQHGIIKKSGAWLSYDGKQIAQGRDQGIKYLKEHVDISKKIKSQVEAALAA